MLAVIAEVAVSTDKPIPIPPRTIVAVSQGSDNPYSHLSGRKIRIGYYSEQDGLDCIWLVYPDGKYGETTDHDHLYRFFVVEELSDESDLYGDGKAPFGPLISN
jgi:hypothetical protein